MIPGDKAEAYTKQSQNFKSPTQYECVIRESQLHALWYGVTTKQALQITNPFQAKALFLSEKLGIKYEQALQFTNEFQVNALRIGATVEQALKVRTTEELEALNLSINEVKYVDSLKWIYSWGLEVLQSGAAPDAEPQAGAAQETPGETDPADPNQLTQFLERVYLDADPALPIAGLSSE